MKILEQLWYGNIEPTEYDASPCKEYKEVLQLMNRNEERLCATMTDEQKELFSHDDMFFPHDADRSDTGVVYYVMEPGSYDLSSPMDATDFSAWVQTWMEGAKKTIFLFWS